MSKPDCINIVGTNGNTAAANGMLCVSIILSMYPFPRTEDVPQASRTHAEYFSDSDWLQCMIN